MYTYDFKEYAFSCKFWNNNEMQIITLKLIIYVVGTGSAKPKINTFKI